MKKGKRQLPAGAGGAEAREQFALVRPTVLDAGAPQGPAGYPGYPPEMERDEAEGLLEYWRLVKRRKGTVIVFATVGVLLAILVTLPQTPVYQARTTVEIQEMNTNFLNMKDVSTYSEPTYGAMYDIQTQIKILQSDTLVERTIEKLKATQPPQGKAAASRVSAWRRALNLPEPQPTEARQEAIDTAADTFKARASGQTRIIELSVDSTDPKIASDFVNTMANEYIVQNIESRWQASQRTEEYLTRQLEDIRIKLERSEDALQAYARKSGLLYNTDEKTSVNEDKLKQIQSSLSTAQADRVLKQSRWEMANDSPPEALPDVLNDQSLREYQTKLTELKRQQAELSATYTANMPKVKKLEPQIATLEQALERERGAILKRIRNEYNEAVRREKLLQADYEAQTRTVSDQGEKAIHYNILKREVDTNRQLYEAMLQRVKETGIVSAMRASNVRVIDAAKPPRLPYKPRIPMNASAGLLAGLMLGVAFVFVTDRANRALQDPGDIQHYLGLPELGIIPAESADEQKKRVKLRTSANLVSSAGLEDRVELVTFQRKPSMISEAFRATLTSILFSGNKGTRPKVLVTTSGAPSEGKSTVTSNLAIAMAETKQKVLVIDADTRKPRQHAIFGVQNDKGLTTLLGLTEEESASSEGLIQETAIPNLFLLPSGPSVVGATNLLYAPQLESFITLAQEEFDLILIDTPPMLQIPDARVLGRLADAVVLVVRAGQTTRDAARAAKQRLMEDGIPIIGTVMTHWNPKNSPGGYYGYYNGDYKAYNGYYGDTKDKQ